jgi:aspartate kinase|tara:strand:+ start:170 stop:1423 length:1254 start_codon:yes stop_codon:yes gene_type:complete
LKIFKFGGASVKNADGVRNLLKVLKTVDYNNTVIIVSAMGKTTNSFEKVVDSYLKKNEYLSDYLFEIENFHQIIVSNLFDSESSRISSLIKNIFKELKIFLSTNKSQEYSFVYDQIVCYGEILSTTIIHNFLISSQINNFWLDARKYIKTDSYYRDSNLNWDLTIQKIKSEIKSGNTYITQGFIASDHNNFTTTLGREGSDYSASIFAYALNASEVTIWKDVAGVLNADPRYFSETTLLEHISYREAIELAFYGASVIHPKTLQPLQRREIPLYVKSFLNPMKNGTTIKKGSPLFPSIPCFILKQNQILLRLSSLDFSFIIEDNISDVFKLLHLYQMRVGLIQNSAISFSVCINNKYGRLNELVSHLKNRFKVEVDNNVSLYTIRHFDQKAIEKIKNNGKNILLEQRAQNTIQFITD